MIDLVKNYSVIARRMKRNVIRELLKLTSQPDIISFAGGLPDPTAFPIEEFKDISREVLDREGASALQYGETEGDPRLRQAIAELMSREGAKVTKDNILVTVASQQGLDLLGRVFIDPSDPVLVELPSYIGGLQAFAAYGAHMHGVPIDEDGLRVDLLEETLEQLRLEEEHYKLIYVVPDFQNPGGVTLSAPRRRKLMDLAEQYQVLVLEDSPYRQIRFEGEDPPCLFSLDESNNVITLGTFSKILVPGVRVGWVMGHPDIIHKLVTAKQSLDLCTPQFCQAIIYEFMRRGLLDAHIEQLKVLYRKKRDAMHTALSEHMPEGVHWTKPQGGLFLFVHLPEHINAEEMFFEAVEQKVAYVIGSAFYCNGRGQNTLRLNFSYPSEEKIYEGIRRLGEVVKKRMTTNHKHTLGAHHSVTARTPAV